MNEIQTIEIKQIELEINFYKEQTAKNIIEIGKRLIKVKEMLPHGEWGKWLEEKVEFRQTTATKYMRVAKEFPNLQSLENLGQTKIFALLEVPKEEREEFIETNPVDDMTTRELREAIREKKQLEREKEMINRVNDDLRKEINELRDKPPKIVEKEVEKVVEVIPPDYDSLKGFQQRHADMCYENSKLEGEIQRLKRQLENKELTSKEYDKLRKELSEKSEKIHELNKQIESLLVTDSKEEHIRKLKDTALTFSARIHSFINSVGGLAWLTDYFDELGEYEKAEYIKALQLLESWVLTIKSNINKEEF